MKTKFRYNDRVKITGTPYVGETVDIIPIGLFNNKAIYHYKVWVDCVGFLRVPEEKLEAIENGKKT